MAQCQRSYADRVAQCIKVDDLEYGDEELGLTVEYAIGFDLSQRVPYEFMVDGLPRHLAAGLVRAAGFVPGCDGADAGWDSWQKVPAWTGPDEEQTGVLIQVANFLCQYQTLIRRRNFSREHMRQIMQGRLETEPLDWYAVNERDADLVWQVYRAHLRERLATLGPAQAGIELANGFGVADLVCGRTLLDVKTVVAPPEDCRQWLRQLAAYYLLDADDTFEIDSVGVVLPRQAAVITWDLDEVFSREALTDLAGLRREAAAIAAAVQDRIAADERRRKQATAEHKQARAATPTAAT
ncbi:MAG TPA: hypothetical protein H9902_14185 [Candidatus Stackebrandtia faecavium]|nr:hypothetical protein [Candidatus Stackebrandtia faecavium]